nr:hypothetical protein [Botrimarina colliarenosi]
MPFKAEKIDDRDQHEGPRDQFEGLLSDQPADGAGAVDLIAMNRRGDADGWPWLLATPERRQDRKVATGKLCKTTIEVESAEPGCISP